MIKEGFVDLAKSWWNSFSFDGTPSFVFPENLKFLKEVLKQRDKEVFGNLEVLKSKLLEAI